MKNDNISVIVPIYNVKEYLVKCLDSIMNQTYQNLEIILIDDGSTDGSEKIADVYAKKDRRIKCIHQKNQGLSIARNNGMKLATSNYYAFIDSDDYISLDFIEYLFKLLIKNDADIAVCSYESLSQTIKHKKEKIIIKDSQSTLKILTKCDGKYGLVAWNKLYKKCVFKNNLFPEGKYYEDVYTVSNAVSKSNRIVLSNQKKYFYNDLRSNSISKLSFNKKEFDRIDSCDKLIKLVNQKYPKLNNHVKFFYILNHIYICDKLLMLSDYDNDYIHETNELILKNIFPILLNDYSLRRKFQVLIFLLNKKIYYKFIKSKYLFIGKENISVIVPIYNVKEYLSKCLDSIINQTYQNLEIILIDDGSYDGSEKIADDYTKKDSRIKCIHQKNQGLSIARNNGMKLATSNYYVFIDSDDYVSNDYVESLYTNLVNTNSDISVCAYNFTNNADNKKERIINLTPTKSLKKMLNFDYDFGIGVCNKLIKKELFSNLKFPEHKRHEDFYILALLIGKSKRIVISNKKNYFYVNRKLSLSKMYDDHEYDRIELSNMLLEYIKINYIEIYNKALIFFIINHLAICDKLLTMNINNADFINKTRILIKNNIIKIIFTRYNYKRKIQLILFIINQKLYLKLLNHKDIIKHGFRGKYE